MKIVRTEIFTPDNEDINLSMEVCPGRLSATLYCNALYLKFEDQAAYPLREQLSDVVGILSSAILALDNHEKTTEIREAG